MSEIARLMGNLASEEGFTPTNLAGVAIYKASSPVPRGPLCYEQGIILVGQGAKRVYYDGAIYEYNPDNYLVLTVSLPAECETLNIDDKPMLAMTVDLDISMLNTIIDLMEPDFDSVTSSENRVHRGLFLTPATEGIKKTVLRLLQTLQSPLESRVLGEQVVFELLYRILCSENGASLYGLTLKNSNLARIDKALKNIHANFHQPVSIDHLAALVNMSPSTFHRTFKKVTASSPIQYLKKIRLNRARQMLLDSGYRVNEAAMEVGYESTSQFSREFKRYFGYNPVEVGRREGVV